MLTIGMAVFDDYDGVYFTIQALRLYNDLRNIQFVVIDNNPDSPHGKETKRLVETKLGQTYIPFVESQGTTQTRQAVFDNAKGEIVVCLDSHVLLAPGALLSLTDYFLRNPESNDLISGPMLYDTLQDFATHFDPIWRAEMLGVWSNAWRCGCHPSHGVTFSVSDAGANIAKYSGVAGMDVSPVSLCGNCDRSLPSLQYAGHDSQLRALGYRRLGESANDAPFAIPGQGLGAFACRRSAWLGFNKHFRGFGGEEIYIHEKFRQHGRQAICLPGFKWLHRFGRPNGVKYPLTRWNKVRNYVLGFNELGKDLQPVYEHFVSGKLVSPENWNALIADPINTLTEPTAPAPACGSCAAEVAPMNSAKEILTYVRNKPRDLDKHFDTLLEYAGRCKTVTEFSKRRESAIVLTASGADVVSYNLEADNAAVTRLAKVSPNLKTLQKMDSGTIKSIEETEMLYISGLHTYKRLTEELRLYANSVTRYIALHVTALHGEKGEDGGPGLLAALRKFMLDNPQWSVLYHSNEQYGLTIAGCRAEDKPQLPSSWKMAANLAAAAAAHVADGLKKATTEQYEARLNVCSICPHRADDRCTICGCYVAAKATMQSSECPIGKWDK